MAETGNTTRTQLINLEGLSAFLDESKKIFEPTLPAGTNGQVLKLSGGKPTWGTDNTPTSFKWTNGTTAGPTGSLTGNGMTAVSFAAIPSAGASASGVVTTGSQTFAGTKTFSSPITGSLNGNASTATSADKTAHSLSVKDGAATPAAAINSWNGSTDKTLTIKGESPVTTTATDGAITITHANSGVSAGTYRSVTVNAKGHVTAGTNPTTLSGYGITDAKIASGVITLGSNTITPLTSASTLAAGKVSGTLAASNIPNLDASKITTGTISVDRLPATALERCVVVADDTARFKLTTSSVQVGDTVKVTATKKMYMVIDSSKLSSEAGYEEYFTSTDWSTITNKPTTFTPSSHSHDAATQSANGFMSAADKKKLDGITASADSVSFSRSLTSGTKVGTITINGTGTDLYAPTNTDTHYKATPVLGASDSTSNASSATGNTTTYLNIVENGGKSGGVQIKGSGATTVSAVNGVLTINSTDTNTTNVSATTTGSGNAVTSVTASGSSITVTKGSTFLTRHQDISGKEDKSNKVTSWSSTTTDAHYPSEKLVKSALDGKAASSHTHTKSQITDFPTSMPASDVYAWAKASTKPSYAWSEITSKPSTFTPASHSHDAATQSANGFMSAADKKKLDGITESADSVSFTRSLTSGTKVGTITINGAGTDLYAPTNTDTHYTAKNVVASSSTGTANVTAATSNPYLNLIENGAVRSTHQIKGSGATTVKTDTSGNIVISSTDTNTTYSNKAAASGGTDVSLVTTGEKYTWNSKANATHNHTKSQITDFPTSMPASDVHDWAKAENKPSYAWSEITNKPSTFTPSTHPHSDATTSASGFMSSKDKAKLDGIAPGAEVNQNAFSNVTVGSTTISADSKTDTLTLTAGNNITLTPDAANDKITISSSYVAASASTSGIVTTETQTFAGAKTFSNTTDSTNNTSGAVIVSGGLGVAKNIYAGAVHNAVWNDLADCIPVDDECKVEPGYCYCFDGERYYKSSKYLDEGIVGIDSDTYGMNMGHKPGLNQMDVAVAGFVLAYVDKEYKPGTPLTCTENGYLTEIKKEDKIEYPERIVATYWKSEPADEWGSDSRKVKVNGRKWVKVV